MSEAESAASPLGSDRPALDPTRAGPKRAQILVAAAAVRRVTGTSKAKDYLDRMRDLDGELTPPVANALVAILASVGDTLLCAQDEIAQGILSFPNRWRMLGVINHLLKHAEAGDRLKLIRNLIVNGHSIALAGDAIETVEELKAKPEGAQDWTLAEVGDEMLVELKTIWMERLRAIAPRDLLDVPEFGFVLYRRVRWGDPNEVIQRVQPLFETDETLPLILEKLLRFGTRHVSGDVAATRIPLLNPKHFERFVDIVAVEPRVRSMLERQDLTENQRIAGERYIRAMRQIKGWN